MPASAETGRDPPRFSDVPIEMSDHPPTIGRCCRELALGMCPPRGIRNKCTTPLRVLMAGPTIAGRGRKHKAGARGEGILIRFGTPALSRMEAWATSLRKSKNRRVFGPSSLSTV
jgi:hypothetical protein